VFFASRFYGLRGFVPDDFMFAIVALDGLCDILRGELTGMLGMEHVILQIVVTPTVFHKSS